MQHWRDKAIAPVLIRRDTHDPSTEWFPFRNGNLFLRNCTWVVKEPACFAKKVDPMDALGKDIAASSKSLEPTKRRLSDCTARRVVSRLVLRASKKTWRERFVAVSGLALT
jgi:hypothetical protein